jgi:uncharacterized protein (DUF305 family)
VLLTVAACSEGGDPVQMALRDAAAARQAAAVKETADVPPATAREPRDATDDGDAAYVASMIEHHRAAVTLAVDALARSDDPEIRRLAQAEIDTRTREITELQAWEPAR